MWRVSKTGALDSGPAEYGLYGITVHEGLRASTDCGHYVAYVRTADGAWWECNDQQARTCLRPAKCSSTWTLHQLAMAAPDAEEGWRREGECA